MRSHEARRLVIDHLEAAGMAVYELRLRYGLPSIGQLVMVDPDNGTARIVRVMVGKRPPRSKRLLIDRRRVGLCDVLAVVDPRDGCVSLEPALPARKHEVAV